jgi:gluconolactonase
MVGVAPVTTQAQAGATGATGASAAEPVMQPTATAGAPATAPAAAGGDDFPSADSFPKVEAEMFGKPTLISSKFDLAEGPVWDHCEKRLLFSDVNTRKIHTYVPGDMDTGVWVEKTNYVNGMIFDKDGSLILAEMGGGTGGRITRMKRDMSIEVLIDKNPSGGQLQTSDDLTMHADGTIYFSDPNITHGPHIGASLVSAPFYQLKPGAPGAREVVRVGWGYGSNGIRLTRDMKTLLVNEYSGGNVAKYAVQADGSLMAAGDFAAGLDSPDSMCQDVAGNVYVGVGNGIQVLRSDGSKVTVMRVGSSTTNCAFGGPDGKTMYITAWSKLLVVENLPIPGLDWYQNKNMKCD